MRPLLCHLLESRDGMGLYPRFFIADGYKRSVAFSALHRDSSQAQLRPHASFTLGLFYQPCQPCGLLTKPPHAPTHWELCPVHCEVVACHREQNLQRIGTHTCGLCTPAPVSDIQTVTLNFRAESLAKVFF